MNVSSVNSATAQYQTSIRSGFKQRSQDFKALESSLQSGDLSGAQQAFAALQKDLPNSSQTTGATSSNASTPTSQLSTDFQALQSALQSGDLSGAQGAFATLQQDMQSAGATQGARRHHHHHQKTGAPGSSSEATSPATSTSGNGTALTSLLDTQA